MNDVAIQRQDSLLKTMEQELLKNAESEQARGCSFLKRNEIKQNPILYVFQKQYYTGSVKVESFPVTEEVK